MIELVVELFSHMLFTLSTWVYFQYNYILCNQVCKYQDILIPLMFYPKIYKFKN